MSYDLLVMFPNIEILWGQNCHILNEHACTYTYVHVYIYIYIYLYLLMIQAAGRLIMFIPRISWIDRPEGLFIETMMATKLTMDLGDSYSLLTMIPVRLHHLAP